MHRRLARARQGFPYLVRGEAQDRSKQAREGIHDLVQRRLRASAPNRLGRKCVQTILQDVDVHVRKSHRRVVVKRMVHGRVVEPSVRIDRLASDFTRDGERPAINLPHIPFRYLVDLRIDVRDISQRIPGCVSALARGVNHAIQDLGRNSHVFLIVRGRSPQTKYLGPLFADDLLRRDRVSR